MTHFVGVYYNLILIVICTDLFIVLKTASFSVKLRPLGSKFKLLSSQYITLRLLSALLLVLLTSCSTNQPVKAPSNTANDGVFGEITVEDATLTAEQHIERAKNANADVATEELLIATKLFYQNKNYVKALWLADKTLSLIDNTTANHHQKTTQLTLIKASCLQELGYFTESYAQLTQFELYATENKKTLTASYYQLLFKFYQASQQPIPALKAQLLAFDLSTAASRNNQQIEAIWQNYQALSHWQLQLLANDTSSDISAENKGWLALTALANKYGGNQKQLQYQLSFWQKTFKYHPANLVAERLVSNELVQSSIQNIAVIIPLTGKQHAAGLAIQQGILASFSNDSVKKLHFLDSNTVNWPDLKVELLTLNIDYVIGPLLKSNVDKYITHTSAEIPNDIIMTDDVSAVDSAIENSSEVAVDSAKDGGNEIITPPESDSDDDRQLTMATDTDSVNENTLFQTLLFNSPIDATLADHHAVLSMNPEDEAIQAAETLSRQHFQRPIVLSQNNIVSKRIAKAFTSQWQHITGNNVDVIYYKSGSQMQENIKASLAVDKSKTRIGKLKSRLNKSIKTQTRNRRDIDMIYLIGTPEQVRLVKPYIEVNISPFSEVIPVYASSRSHSSKSDYSSNSDLQGLTFTEIPWLLPTEQNAELAALSKQLWPKRTDGMSRLFAMGYDSYQLINKIPLMKQAPYLQHWGQSGVLKLDQTNTLTRSFLWAKYKRNKVESIVMD